MAARVIWAADGVNRAADELRAKGVRAMVAVFHEGLELGTEARRGDWNDTTCPEAHGPILDIARRLVKEGFQVDPKTRTVRPSSRPGLGIEIDEAEVRKHPFQQELLQRTFYADGSVGDW